MSPELSQLESAVLLLPAEERARLAQRLIESLDANVIAEDDWANETKRRVEEFRSGEVQPVPGRVVFDDVERLLR